MVEIICEHSCKICGSKMINKLGLVEGETYCRCSNCGRIHVSCENLEIERKCDEKLRSLAAEQGIIIYPEGKPCFNDTDMIRRLCPRCKIKNFGSKANSNWVCFLCGEILPPNSKTKK